MDAMKTPRELTPLEEELECLPPRIQSAFLPLRKHAMGVAIGATSALLLCFLNSVMLMRFGEGKMLWLLSNYFPGYNPDEVLGVLIGICWAAAYGYASGWLLTALRNRVLSAYKLMIRSKAQLLSDSDFLDQI
jgi:hypothetical protein